MEMSQFTRIEEQTLDAATYAAFFMEGLRREDRDAVVATWSRQCIRLVMTVTASVPQLMHMAGAAVRASNYTLSFPAALEIAVCEQFGRWLAGCLFEHDEEIPDERQCMQWLAEAVLTRCRNAADPALTLAVTHEVRRAAGLRDGPGDALGYEMNWEWIDRISPQALRNKYGGEHVAWPRGKWQDALAAGSARLDYWDWVADSIGVGVLEMRYAAIAAERDVFFDALAADVMSGDGSPPCEFKARRDLVAQEILGGLPSRTVITRRLLDCRPEIAASFSLMHPGFERVCWLGRPLAEFLDRYAVAQDPDTTPVLWVPLPESDASGCERYTLRDLWSATPGKDCWRLASGAELRFVPAGPLVKEEAAVEPANTQRVG